MNEGSPSERLGRPLIRGRSLRAWSSLGKVRAGLAPAEGSGPESTGSGACTDGLEARAEMRGWARLRAGPPDAPWADHEEAGFRPPAW